jgi:hypothetical protein
MADAAITLSTVHGDWSIAMPEMKLRLRGRLPGASAFDEAAVGLRTARAANTPLGALLAAAMASSWLVNSAIPSPVFQKWLGPAVRTRWEALIAALEGPDDEATWSKRSAADRSSIDEHLTAIAAVGGTLGGISKVLSLLSAEPIPLMPDAALALVLRAVPVPAEADAQTAPLKHFAAMMDKLAETEDRAYETLEGLAERAAPMLRPRDVVDRLVWFDSVGYRHFKNDQGGWYWVRSESLEGVVFVPGKPPEAPVRATACIDVPAEDDFSQRAHAALTEAVSRA